jgi:hypothetical protein
MLSPTRSSFVARLAVAPLLLALAGCMGMGGDEPETTATTEATGGEEQIDIRRYLGPDYCPEIRIPEGFELIRRFERGHEEDSDYVVWQASIGRTARECLYDREGGLLLRVGVSGRVIAGPKGGPGDVTVPLRIVIEKYQESELANQSYQIAATIPATNSTVFTQVYEFNLPSPGDDRDYLIHVGFDPTGEGFVAPPEPEVVQAPPPPPPPPEPQPEPEPEPEPEGPNVLPVPEDGVVLPGGW